MAAAAEEQEGDGKMVAEVAEGAPAKVEEDGCGGGGGDYHRN